MFKLKKATQFKNLVTFLPNRKEPIHNWYYYKEGFSKQLVDYFLNKFQINKNQTVLDPFSGIGTTNLTCKQSSINSIGFEISPLFVFISKVKTADYNLQELEKSVKQALKWKFKKPETPKEKHIKKLFSKYVLEDIIFYKNKISEIQDKKIRDFLLLALIDSGMKSSFAYKDGALVRRKKRNLPPLSKTFKYKIRMMLKDLKNSKTPEVSTEIQIGDARSIKLPDNSIDSVITSPPYLNKKEYTKIYRTEFSLFLDLPEPKSYFGEKDYFKDMEKVISELYRVCKPSAKLAIVIGGGCFPDKVIHVDEETANLAEQAGFKVNEILVARELWCTKKRTIKVGKTRESIILLEK